MASRYSPIWEELKKKRTVVVKCRAAKAATLVRAVKKLKSKEQAPKIALDLPSFGKLKINVKDIANAMSEVTFNLVLLARGEDL